MIVSSLGLPGLAFSLLALILGVAGVVREQPPLWFWLCVGIAGAFGTGINTASVLMR